MNYNFQWEAIFMGFVPVLSWLLCWGFLVLPKICYQHCSIPGIKCYISAMICCGKAPAPPYFFLLFLFFLVALLLTGLHWLSYKSCPGHVPGVCYWGLGVLEKPEATISGAEFRMQTGDGCKERSRPGWELQAAKGLSE